MFVVRILLVFVVVVGVATVYGDLYPCKVPEGAPAPTPAPTPSDDPCEGRKLGSSVQMPGNCAKFLVCGTEVIQDCPSGLYFDTKSQVCNYPAQVACPQ